MSDQQQREYVQQTADGGWRVAGTRVSLDSVVYGFLEGLSPEEIVSQFPALSLEQVYGAIAFYLRHRQELDEVLAGQRERWEELRRQQAARSDPLLDRLRQARPREPIHVSLHDFERGRHSPETL